MVNGWASPEKSAKSSMRSCWGNLERCTTSTCPLVTRSIVGDLKTSNPRRIQACWLSADKSLRYLWRILPPGKRAGNGNILYIYRYGRLIGLPCTRRADVYHNFNLNLNVILCPPFCEHPTSSSASMSLSPLSWPPPATAAEPPRPAPSVTLEIIFARPISSSAIPHTSIIESSVMLRVTGSLAKLTGSPCAENNEFEQDMFDRHRLTTRGSWSRRFRRRSTPNRPCELCLQNSRIDELPDDGVTGHGD